MQKDLYNKTLISTIYLTLFFLYIESWESLTSDFIVLMLCKLTLQNPYDILLASLLYIFF